MQAGRTLFLIALGLFGLYTVEFGVVGILPEVVDRFHVSVAKAGWLVALFALIVASLGPLMVLGLAGVDRRKVLAGALLTFSACSALSALAPGFWLLMALRIPSALLHPVYFSAAFATAVSLYPPERATHATTMAFVGTSMGMVFGVPLTAWIAARISYEGSFTFCAIVNAVAAIGLLALLPASKASSEASPWRGAQIMRLPSVWLATVMSICVFASGFSVYSYAAEYLARVTGRGGETVGMLLVVFGAGGVLGNLITGRILARHRIATTLAYPVALAASFGVLAIFGSPSLLVMVPVCLIWGAAHTSGLVVSQMWMTSAAPYAQEFATSIYLSAANVGVMLGALIGGPAITAFGVAGALAGGWAFATLALAVIVARIVLERRTGGSAPSAR